MSKRQRDLEVQKPQGEHREEMVSEMAAFKCRGRWKATGVGGGGKGAPWHWKAEGAGRGGPVWRSKRVKGGSRPGGSSGNVLSAIQ